MILDLLNAIARKQGIEHCTLPLITLAAWLDMETLERHTRAAYSLGVKHYTHQWELKP